MAASDAGIIGAIISSAIAVVVAVGTQVWTSLRSRTDRRYSSRRAGIGDAQDAMRDLRDALADFGVGIRPGHSAGLTAPQPDALVDTGVGGSGSDLESRRRRATDRFVVCVSRVHDDAIVEAMTTWRSAAERRFISVEEVTASAEDEWFTYVQGLCRVAMVSDTGTTDDRSRKRLEQPPPLAGE